VNLTVDGKQVFAYTAAHALDAARPTVVFLHGAGLDHSWFALQSRYFGYHGRNVLALDLPGHARSDGPPLGSVEAMADWVVRALDAAGLAKAALVGHSMGGAAGVIAAADGAPIDGLVLVAAPSDVLRVTAEFLTDQGRPGHLLVALLLPFFWRRVGGSFRPLTPSRRIRELDIPLLMIQPELDQRVYRGHAERLSAAAGQPYHVIEGYEHTDVLGAPETLALIEDFLEQV